jgi:hypothetical protein
MAARGDKYAAEAYTEFFSSPGGMSETGAAALFCNEKGIPLSQFLGWPMADQIAALVAQEEAAMRDALTRFEGWKKQKRKQKR